MFWRWLAVHSRIVNPCLPEAGPSRCAQAAVASARYSCEDAGCMSCSVWAACHLRSHIDFKHKDLLALIIGILL